MTIIVDTSVWIDFFASRNTAETTLLEGYLKDDFTDVALADLILCEILQGIKNSSQEAEIRHNLLLLPIFSTGGTRLAIAASSNYRKLRAKGFTVRSTIDCLLATFAMENNYHFLHNDRDFVPFEEHLGLKVIKPLTTSSF